MSQNIQDFSVLLKGTATEMRGWILFPFLFWTQTACLAAVQSWKMCLILNWQRAPSADYFGRAVMGQPSLPTCTSASGCVSIFSDPQSLRHFIALSLCYREWFSSCPFPRFLGQLQGENISFTSLSSKNKLSIHTPLPQRYTQVYGEALSQLCPKNTSSLRTLTHESTPTDEVTVCNLAWVFNLVTCMRLCFICCHAITRYSLPWLWCFLLFCIFCISDSLESQLMARKQPKWIWIVLHETSLSGEAQKLLLATVNFFCLALLLTFNLLLLAEELAKLCVYCDFLLI